MNITSHILSFLQAVISQAQAEVVVGEAAHEGGVVFTKLFLRYESLMITAASWVLVQVLQKSLGKMAESSVFVRMKPALPVIISIGMAFLPRFRLGSWDETLLYGIVLGSLTGFGQKVLKQTLFGQDYRIKPIINNPELRQKIDDQLKAQSAGENGRQKLRDRIKDLIT